MTICPPATLTNPQLVVSFGSGAPISSKEDPLADVASESGTSAATYPVLIRATDGKVRDKGITKQRLKLATVVDSDSLDAFYARYAEICKAGMLALKPRDRSKRKTKGKKKKPTVA